MMYGMRQMAAAGMEFATVAHFGHNEAARGLYQACGFKPWHTLDGYVKFIPEQALAPTILDLHATTPGDLLKE
jgi:hypothetical protein